MSFESVSLMKMIMVLVMVDGECNDDWILYRNISSQTNTHFHIKKEMIKKYKKV